MILSNILKNETYTQSTDPNGWLDILGANREDMNAKTSFYVSPFAAAHRIFTNSMGALPIKLYKKENENREPFDNHHTDYAMSVRSNALMSPFIAKKIAASQSFLYGESFILPIYQHGKLKELIPLLTPNVQKHKDDLGDKWIIVTIDDEVRKFKLNEVINLFWETADGRSGIGVLEMAKEALVNDKMGQKYAGKFYKNGARPSGIIEVDSSLSTDAKDKIRATFEKAHSGADNAFRVAVMDSGMKYTQMGINQKDAQYLESRNFTIEEVSRFTGIPLYKLQAGKQSYESNEQQGIEYVVNTLQPTTIQWEQEYNYKLLTEQEQRAGLYYKHNLAAEMRGDNKSRAEFYQKMVHIGVYNPNECRALEEKNSYDGGDEYFMTKNLSTVKSMLKEEDERNG